jgi:hypothetical protein
MVQCLSAFLELCYIFRRNAITVDALDQAKEHLSRFHELRQIFVDTGTRAHTSLPRQHALTHFITSIIDFGSPNGLCSSITESRHITAVKEPWRRSNRFNALSQMLVTINRLDKMNTLHRLLSLRGLLDGSVAYGMALSFEHESEEGGEDWEIDQNGDLAGYGYGDDNGDADTEGDDEAAFRTVSEVGPVQGPRLASSVVLCATHGTHQHPSCPLHASRS